MVKLAVTASGVAAVVVVTEVGRFIHVAVDHPSAGVVGTGEVAGVGEVMRGVAVIGVVDVVAVGMVAIGEFYILLIDCMIASVFKSLSYSLSSAVKAIDTPALWTAKAVVVVVVETIGSRRIGVVRAMIGPGRGVVQSRREVALVVPGRHVVPLVPIAVRPPGRDLAPARAPTPDLPRRTPESKCPRTGRPRGILLLAAYWLT